MQMLLYLSLLIFIGGFSFLFLYLKRKNRSDSGEKKNEEDWVVLGNLFWNVFNTSEFPIILIKDYKIVNCNKMAINLFGGKSDEILGKAPFELSPEFQPDGSASAKIGKELFDKILFEGNASFEWRHRKINGELFLAQVSASSFEANGTYYAAATIRDITKSRQEETELQNYRLKLEQLVEEKTKQLENSFMELQAINEELDASNEELYASNEELHATNEELDLSNKALSKEIEEHKKTQTAKAIIEEKLNQFISQSSEAIIIINDKGIVEDWNRTMAEITGVSKEKALGSYIWDVTYTMAADPEKAEFVRERFKDQTIRFFEEIKNGNTKEQVSESHIRHSDSSIRFIYTTLFPIATNNNIYGGVIISDITQKKAIEAQLEEYRTELEKLLEQRTERLEQLSVRFNEVYSNSSDAITFMDIMDDGQTIKVFDMNPVAKRLFKISDEQLDNGLLIEELLPEIKIESFRNQVLPKALTGSSVTFTESKDTGNGYWHSTIYPIKNQEGKVYRIASFSRNITSEYERDKMAAILQAAIDSWPFDFWARDVNGKIILQNKISVKKTGNLIGTRQDVFKITDEKRDEVNRMISRALRGEHVSTDLDFIKNGKLKYLIFKLNPIFDKDEIIGYAGIAIDNTEQKTAEISLRESEERFRQIAKLSKHLVYDYNLISDKIKWDGAIEEVTGYSRAEYKNLGFDHWAEMIHPEDKHLALDLFRKSLTNKSDYTAQYRYRNIKNQYLWIEEESHIILDSNNTPVKYLGVLRDITERKLAEEKIRLSEEKYRLLAENIDDVIWKLDINTLKYTYCSPSIFKLTGYTVKEVLNLEPDQILMPDSYNHLSIALLEWMNQYNKTGQGINKTFEYQIRHKNGQPVWVEINAAFITDNSGAIKEIVATSRSIEERRAIQSIITESEEKLRTIFETSKDGIVVVDKEMKVLDINPSALERSGYKYDEIAGKSIFGFLLKENIPSLLHYLKSMLKNKEVRTFETDVIIKNHGSFPVEISASSMEFNKKKVLLILIRDISERKQHEKELLQSVINTEERERINFSQELHDGLGPLLSAAKMYVEWLAEPDSSVEPEKIIPDIKKLLEESTKTVKDISFKLSPHILQNYGVLESLKAYAEKVEKTGKTNIHMEAANIPRFDELTETIVYRVVCECINNTLKHANANKIVINMLTADNSLFIKYSDDGKGFDVEKVRIRNKGIGLLNMQSRLKSINGSFSIQSSINNGTSIIIKVPISVK